MRPIDAVISHHLIMLHVAHEAHIWEELVFSNPIMTATGNHLTGYLARYLARYLYRYLYRYLQAL